ncbi:hypothetical protein A0H81_04306 [Grifola frondosa]|uniref:Mediator complex subunit 16 C-terminal domain-containing protein n=1 Tax=Grifola frondosa TaxID=5627 RepID=A0A1C7MG46_GRIFR|nr:hypothetical protein A0H81_04306 [Grifola frondosa]
MSLLDSDSNGLSEMWMGEILGVAIEVYMARARRAENSPDKDKLTACWRIAHDIASLSACCSAFEDCQEGEVYDLDAIWQLIGMTSWFIILIEKLLKQCVMADGHPVPLPVKTIEADISFEHPIFLLLAHPYALSRVQTVLAHVRRFRRHVAGVSAKGENSQIAKDVLIDVIDGCGANLDILGPVLSDVLRDTKTLSVDDLRRSLVSCCPVPALRVHMRKEVDRVLNSKVIDRPRLFVKPGDLIDGISCISMVEHHIKEKDMDIVSKGLLLHSKSGNLCLRCGGKSEVLVEGTGEAGDASLRWRTWEKAWTRRCVCGGTWIHSSV